MSEDTRTKTEQDIEMEKNSTATPNELSSNEPVEAVPKPVKKYRKQRTKLTTSNVSEEAVGQAYVDGKITSKEWSLMSPALRKVCERYAKKHKQAKKVDTVESSEE